MSAFLYRMYSEADDLLYVGSAIRPGRISEHAYKGWWADVTRIDVEHFDDVADALAAEVRAIKAEKPFHNIGHRGQRRRTVKASPANPQVLEELRMTAAQRDRVMAERDDLIRSAITGGASLREVGAAVGLSHTAVKFIAHGRPTKDTQ